jgi:hypothetical protein
MQLGLVMMLSKKERALAIATYQQQGHLKINRIGPMMS